MVNTPAASLQTHAQPPLFIQGKKHERDRTYRGAEFSCSLKASLVVCPSEGLHMMKLATVSFQSLKYTKAFKNLLTIQGEKQRFGSGRNFTVFFFL